MDFLLISVISRIKETVSVRSTIKYCNSRDECCDKAKDIGLGEIICLALVRLVR
jgi:hypothetical protein